MSREIAAPAAEVWALMAEFRHWPHWGPTVRRIESESAEVAVGVTGKVHAPLGLRLPFVITDVEEERSWDWKVAGVQATGHIVTPLDEQRCRATFTVPWLVAPYAAVLNWGLRRLAVMAESRSAG